MKKNFICYFLLLFSFNHSIFALETPPTGALRKDFDLLFEKIENKEDTFNLKKLKKYKVVMVGGIFTNLFSVLAEKVDWINRLLSISLLDSFRHQKEFFNKYKVKNEILEINTQLSCRVNGDHIASYLQQQKDPIIMLVHSKGGLDLLEALVEHPEIRSKVKGVISVQTPYLGTPIVENLYQTSTGHSFVKIILDYLKGEKAAIDCIHSKYRFEFLSKNSKILKEIFANIPFIMLGSWEKVSKRSWQSEDDFENKMDFGVSILDPLNRYVASRGEVFNDGLVPVRSTCINLASCLALEDMDHAGPVMDAHPFKSYGKTSRLLFSKTILQMLMQMMDNK